MHLDYIVDCVPKRQRNKHVANVGLEIVAKVSGAQKAEWHDLPEIAEGEIVGFNVLYPMHVINALACINKNNLKSSQVVMGGQGVSNLKCFLDDFGFTIFKGELDGSCTIQGWTRAIDITSDPIILEKKRAVIELQRGCKHKCYFCEYSWATGGPYREKDITLVKDQIKHCIKEGSSTINFLGVNLPGYSDIDALLDFCSTVGVTVQNRDVCLRDFGRILNWVKKGNMKYMKVGVESFDEKTRKRVGKPMTDARLEETFDKMFTHCSAMHLYLMYGLPGDDYTKWFDWIRRLGKKRQAISSKYIRIDTNITNFEPCIGTPMSDKAMTDFKAKDEFLDEWSNVLVESGLHKNKATYKTCQGRFGRTKPSYEVLMFIKNDKPSDCAKLAHTLKNGIGRNITSGQAEKFMKAVT